MKNFFKQGSLFTDEELGILQDTNVSTSESASISRSNSECLYSV